MSGTPAKEATVNRTQEPALGSSVIRHMMLLNRRIPLLVLIAWGVFCIPRPFRLGLYTDDWWALIEATHGSAPFSVARLANFVGWATSFPARPVAGFVNYLMSSIAGQSAVLHQVCS